MSRAFSTRYPTLPNLQKQALTTMLLRSNPDCVIGIGIRIFLEKEDRLDELIFELQKLASVNPGYMAEVIGADAIELLFSA